MKWTCEQYLDLMTSKHAERPMFVELFGLLIGLDDEWRRQGATEDEINLSAFDWDYVPRAASGAHTGFFGGPKPVVLEDNDEFLVQRDGLGRTMKLPKKTATIALPLDFPVKTMDDWLRLKPYFTYRDERIDWAQVERAQKEQTQGALVTTGIPGAFDMVRELMGEELACMGYYDQPELIRDMVETFRATSVRVLEQVSERLTIDQLSVHEDMAGRSGPLAGPAQVREFFQPYFRAVWDLLSSRGTKLFDMDSDGNMNPILDELLDCGLNAIHPCEPAAGMDIVAIRRKYGRRLGLRGGIDKFVLSKGKAAIRAELEYKLAPALRQGGTVFGLDHRIPNGTPLAGYRYYVALGREMLGLPPLSAGKRGWARMAF